MLVPFLGQSWLTWNHESCPWSMQLMTQQLLPCLHSMFFQQSYPAADDSMTTFATAAGFGSSFVIEAKGHVLRLGVHL